MTRNLLWIVLALSAGWILSCEPKDPMEPEQQPPLAPDLLAAIQATLTEITLSWHDRSSDEDGFRVEMRESGTETWLIAGTAGMDIEQFIAANLEPGIEYQFRVWAFNEAGLSDTSSNVVTAGTDSEELPTPPNNIEAIAWAPTVVHITWNDRSTGADFLVSRRQDSTAWQTLATRPDNTTEYTDSSAAAENEYYYRVGAQTSAGISWSADSATISTPAPGAPQAPDSLRAEIHIGTGIYLTWRDMSLDETEFHIRRNISGHTWEYIDTVSANITSYFDSLGANAEDIYSYQVRAANALGNSSWCIYVTADYRYCSPGVIPICIGNFWSYVETEGSQVRNISRRIVDVGYLNNLDYYLEVVNEANDPEHVDTLQYLRNIGNGCYAADWPLHGGSTSELLFRYPPGGNFPYFFGQDCVKVLLENTAIEIGDTTYTGLILYQRWLHGTNNSIRYFVKPENIGIVREEVNEGATNLIRRDIYDYYIRN